MIDEMARPNGGSEVINQRCKGPGIEGAHVVEIDTSKV